MKTLLASLIVLSSVSASAMSVDWTGQYRFEWTQVDRPSLTDPANRKAYGLNYLGLSPHLIASDGVEISAQFDVLSNQDAAYASSQSGQIWGDSTTTPKVLSQSKNPTSLQVRELYLNVNQEYGSLLVGRAPLDFGLGIFWNAGRGDFDHWSTTADVMAYRFIIGNMSLMPLISRISSNGTSAEQLIQEEAIQFQYESEESGSLLALMMSRRKASTPVNDTPATIGGGSPVTDGYSMQTTSFVLGRRWESFRFKMEADFVSGEYGIMVGGENVKNSGYGVAIDMEFPRPESKWSYSLKTGVASGDDPNTADNYEGFQFHRNYDVAMLLFNHRLGQRDFLGTDLIKDATKGTQNSIDDEAISNAMFFSPKIGYAMNERWDLNNRFTYAQVLNAPKNSVDFKKDLGLEWDMELVYKPRTNVRWVNELGLLFPGAAFKNGTQDLTNGFTYGFATKAAITF